MQRRLTTIVAADVAGYSRLIGLDEEGTLAALRGHREALIDPLLEQHGGRIANTAGDSLLIEFPSAVEAVRCAITVQEGMAGRNAEVPEDHRIEFRVGINVGDVVDQDGDLLGDGVNIAARLEAQAPPGGIVLSRAARDQIRDRLDLNLADLGEVEVKNIARPVRAFQVAGDGISVVSPRAKPGRRWVSPVAVATAVLLLAGVGWWQWQQPDFEPADPAKMAYALPDKPSIAVLAFDNLSGDPDQEYIADGFSEDITSVLARIPEFFVIARNSAFSYKGKPTKVQTIAEELGVRFILEGSLQRSENTLRVTAQLIDALDGRHVWTNRYDRDMTDLFSVRDEIVHDIALAMNDELNPNILTAFSKRPSSIEAWLLTVQAWSERKRRTKEGYLRALELAEMAFSLEPDSIYLMEVLSWMHQAIARNKVGQSPAISRQRSIELANMVVETDPDNPTGYAILGVDKLLIERDFESGVALMEKSVRLAPSSPRILALMALFELKLVRTDAAIERFEASMRLDPRYADWIAENYAEALRIAGRHRDAIKAYDNALARGTTGYITAECHLGLALSFDAIGQSDRAREEVAKAVASLSSLNADWLSGRWKYGDPELGPEIIADLVRLGLPKK